MNHKNLISTAAATAVAAVLLVGCGSSGKGGDESTSSSSYEVTEKATLLTLDNKGGSVDITASDRSTVKVTEERSDNGDKPKTAHSVNSGELRLTNSGCDSGSCDVDYRIEIPRTLAVKISTAGGTITGDGLAADTGISAEGGDVTVAFSSAPDSIDASTAGGDVTVTVPDGSYAVDATTAGGSRTVKVTNDAASAHKIKARSEGGDVTVRSAS
ncbi:DUF4097 family beta strand repeat-containing protein [Streptomyces sp. NPDC058220]|uniref:DUF4097 family beta strand repeat-containing protein n=1 Tax=unclassified Streptomyces TaxID=2593676 RepID=UPI00364DA703